METWPRCQLCISNEKVETYRLFMSELFADDDYVIKICDPCVSAIRRRLDYNIQSLIQGQAK